jgi:cytochrome c-type biogenesis protein CcmH
MGVWIALPLWRRPLPRPAEHLAAFIYRDQLEELEADLAQGTLTQERYAVAREELERRVLQETSRNDPLNAVPTASRTLAAVLFVVLPLGALGLYRILGHPQAIGISKQAAADSSAMTPEHFSEMTEKLAARLQQDPSDARAWLMLAKAYKVLDRNKDAAAALEKGIALKPDDPDMLTEYAEVLALGQGGSFAGKPEQAIQRVLSVAPNHPKGLTMAGALAFEKKNYSGAIAHWQKLFKQLKHDPELQKALLAGISEASRLRTVASTPAQAITGRVQLDSALAGNVDPADTVFIFARAEEGPGMPVAAMRRHARELPITFRLDDTYAVNPSTRLGSLSSIVVGARISKSGDATPHPGDLQALSAPLKLGASGVVLTINEVVK